MAKEFTMEVDYCLKPNQPKMHKIDFDELDELLLATIDNYLNALSDSLAVEALIAEYDIDTGDLGDFDDSDDLDDSV